MRGSGGESLNTLTLVIGLFRSTELEMGPHRSGDSVFKCPVKSDRTESRRREGSGTGCAKSDMAKGAKVFLMNQTWATQINKLTWVIGGPEQVNRAQRKKLEVSLDS